MKHKELSVGDLVLQKSFMGTSLEVHAVIKVTAKTLFTRSYPTGYSGWRHTGSSGETLYQFDEETLRKVDVLAKKIEGLRSEMGSLIKSLERVEYDGGDDEG